MFFGSEIAFYKDQDTLLINYIGQLFKGSIPEIKYTSTLMYNWYISNATHAGRECWCWTHIITFLPGGLWGAKSFMEVLCRRMDGVQNSYKLFYLLCSPLRKISFSE